MVRFLSWLRVGLLAAVAAVSVANVVCMVGRVPPVKEGLPSAASATVRGEHRFARVRGALASRGISGTIGFIGDLPFDQADSADRAVEDYYLAQFSLVPVVLDRNADACGWAVASLHGARPEREIASGWQVVEDTGGGVLLLKRGNR
jgi:hypothetical protein